LNVGFFAAVDELAVSYTALATSSTEAYNPESTEISFAAFAVNSSPDGGSYDSFFGQAINVTCRSAASLCCFEDSFPGPVPCRAFSDSWHISFPLRILGFFGLLAAADSKPRSKPVPTHSIGNKNNLVHFGIYIPSRDLTVLAVPPVITSEPAIRLRRLAFLPLIR
jgi:hypothetical protein